MKFNFLPVAILISLTLSFSAQTASCQSGSRASGSGTQGSARQNSAMQGSGTQNSAPGQESEEAKAFRELQQQIKANQARIDVLFRTLPIGFPELRKKHKDEIDRLTAINDRLKTEVFDKAKGAFASSAQPSAQSTQILEKQLKAYLSPKNPDENFNPEAALELIALLKEKFPNAPNLLQYEFIANYAVERFENAEKALEALGKAIGTELTGPMGLLKDTKDKYQQELMIRRQEAGNNDLPEVVIKTSEGDIKVQLFENHAPNTVASFIHLIRDQKFYDGKLFHLVKPGEYAVTGSPNGDGMGDAGYRIACECEGDKIRSHFRGTLSMMAPSKDRGGSQFFITQQPNPHTYDGKYTAFGRVIDGMDVVLKLKTIDRTAGIASASNASKIIRAEVTKARDHAYMPEKTSMSSGFPSFSTDTTESDNVESFDSGSGTQPSAASDDENLVEDGDLPIETEVESDAPSAFDLLIEGSGSDN